MFRHRWIPVVFFTLLLIVFATLGAQDAFSRASQDAVARTFDDAEDIHRALEVLRDAIIDTARTNTIDPVSEVLSDFAHEKGTSFSVLISNSRPYKTCYDENADDISGWVCVDFSTDASSRPRGVSPEEWKDFTFFLSGENLSDDTFPDPDFTLVDLNDDGVRDLLVTSRHDWIECWTTHVFQADDEAGFRLVVPDDAGPCFFDINGYEAYYLRAVGSLWNPYLLKINGQIYFAFRLTKDDDEVVTLRRPLRSTNQNDADKLVRVRYNVSHRVDFDDYLDKRSTDTQPDGPDIDRAVFDQLNLIFENRTRADALCPVRVDQYDQGGNGLEDDPGTYELRRFPIDYTSDQLDMFAVKTPEACYLAQVMALPSRMFESRGDGDEYWVEHQVLVQWEGGFYAWGYPHCCWVELRDHPSSEPVGVHIQTQRAVKDVELTTFKNPDTR